MIKSSRGRLKSYRGGHGGDAECMRCRGAGRCQYNHIEYGRGLWPCPMCRGKRDGSEERRERGV